MLGEERGKRVRERVSAIDWSRKTKGHSQGVNGLITGNESLHALHTLSEKAPNIGDS